MMLNYADHSSGQPCRVVRQCCTDHNIVFGVSVVVVIAAAAETIVVVVVIMIMQQ